MNEVSDSDIVEDDGSFEDFRRNGFLLLCDMFVSGTLEMGTSVGRLQRRVNDMCYIARKR